MKRFILLSLLVGCSATFDADAEQSCHDIFDAWATAASGCGYESSMPDPNQICWRAYDVDDDALSSCLAWIRSGACEEYHNAQFQAHCGSVISLRTW